MTKNYHTLAYYKINFIQSISMKSRIDFNKFVLVGTFL